MGLLEYVERASWSQTVFSLYEEAVRLVAYDEIYFDSLILWRSTETVEYFYPKIVSFS